jgi:glucose/arabinose dehydrogenase
VELVVDGLDAPTGVTSADDGSGRLFVNEQAGKVRLVSAGGALRPQPFVDLSSRIRSGGERGLLGLAFHPGFATNRRLFVDYTRAEDGATVVSELRASADGSQADPASERILLVVPQPFANHNGGQLAFGPDGDLYIGLGDGGSGGDPMENGQNRNVLLGKILRIDVDAPHAAGKAYAIPPDNPYAARGSAPGDGRPEVWAYGLRNPWRFSFDRLTADLYIGAVGQGSWEEIDRQPRDPAGGANYGWNLMEGDHCFRSTCDPTGLIAPIAGYSHAFGCSVTGGYVYPRNGAGLAARRLHLRGLLQRPALHRPLRGRALHHQDGRRYRSEHLVLRRGRGG